MILAGNAASLTVRKETMVMSDEAIRARILANRRNWNVRAPIHASSSFYGIGTRDATSWFAPFEWRDLGELGGREVVHLQCHIGAETMAFAQKGAHTTGLDFSDVSVREARRIAEIAGLAIEYVNAEVEGAVEALGPERFDIVYTGKGALCYLPDLAAWAQTIWRLLKPGGFLYLVEFHPLFNALGPTRSPCGPDDLTIRHDYLGGRGAIERNSTYTYTDGPPLAHDTVHYEWAHGLGEVVSAVAQAGLTIDSLTETDLLPWKRWPLMVQTDNGWWAMPESQPRFPVIYGLKATKPPHPYVHSVDR
jgi:SAM-dependent methyltransferase